jgi:hypothetical protein
MAWREYNIILRAMVSSYVGISGRDVLVNMRAEASLALSLIFGSVPK